MAISIAKLAIHLTTETGQMIAGFSRAKLLVNGFAASMNGGGGGAIAGLGGMSLAATAATAGIATMTAAIGAFIYEGVRMNATTERMQVSLAALLGSKDEAASLLADMRAFDKVSPLGFEEIAQGAQVLATVGVELENLRGSMYLLGELSVASGKPINELAIIFGQVRNAGRLMTQDMNQFAAANIPLIGQLATNFGVTGAEIRKMTEEGKISFADFNQALTDLATGQGRLAGQSAAAADTISGRWSKLTATFSEWAGNALAVWTPFIKGVIETATIFLETLIKIQRAWASLTGIKLPELGKETTSKEREKEIQAASERIAAAQKEADAIKQMEDQAKKAAEESQRRMDAMRQRADSLTKSLRNPAEVWKDTVSELNQLLENNLINWETYTRGIEQATQALESTSKASRLSTPDRPVGGVVQGTAAARSAVFAAQNEMSKLAEQSRQQTELAKQAKAQRDAMLTAIRTSKPIDVREVNL